ncbi:hypothetical protein GHT06_011489 [Daphnia sinensis]|uniref:Reverse transcriptase domain-containing protein n=1 Tax=Daphnia sinensis TaxID=1820382 RepID=A0AAD5KU05_9CRUS|nr:hypothetical protein GHT06_011489 [Daphnia sinensis]
MDEFDGGAPSDPPGSDRQCKHCNKTFQIVHNGHRCCSPECTKAQQALKRLSSSTSTAMKKTNKRKKDTQSPDKVDSNGTKKSKADTVSAFIAEHPLATINWLSKTDLVSSLCSALSLLENQLLDISELQLSISQLSDVNVSVLESKVARLSNDLEIQEDQVQRLKHEAVQMKPPGLAGPAFSGPSYASVARNNPSSSILVAKCADVSVPPLNVQAVEDLLDTPNSGLIPSHVCFKNNKMFVTLDSEVAVAKAAALLNNRPDFNSRFEPASKLNVSNPVVALFVNVSDVNSLKPELEHRNCDLRGQIHSVKVIYTKPQTTEGHVKIFLKSRAVREVALAQGRVSILGTYYRVVNLRHSSLASSSLAQVIIDLNIDIVLVQEPYALPCIPPVVANVPPGFSSYHQLSADHAYGAAIQYHISNSVACVELSTTHGPLRFSSIYLPWDKVRKSATDGDVFRVLSDFKGKPKPFPLPSEILIDGAPSTDPVPPAISDWELESAVHSLNPKSAPGIDGISADLLLFSLPLIKPFLSVILNAYILMCFFPASWKISKVAVIGKPNKGDYTSLNSYRPISLVSNLAKILEKVFLGRLVWLARTGDWISTNQHGFRENRSTETAAHSLISFIEVAFTERKVCASAFLDLKSAFDSAWHPAIISALAKRSCPNYLIKIIHSFLSNRLVKLPPWRIVLNTTNLSYATIALLSNAPNTLRCFIRVYQCRETAGFCAVFSDSTAVISILNHSLPSSVSFRVGLSIAVSEAFRKITDLKPKYSNSEIYVTEKLKALNPATVLFPSEANNLALLVSLGRSCHIFTATSPNSPGLILAGFWAKSPSSPCSTRNIPFSPNILKQQIKSYVTCAWHEEWLSLPTNLSVKAFFPDVQSAKMLLKIKTSALSTQLFTGHGPLNSYQHRFGFISSASCRCGASVESVVHYLFQCPIYYSFRKELADTLLASQIPWPPPLCLFPKSHHSWNALIRYILSTKRFLS